MSGNMKKILIIEDDKILHKAMMEALYEEGYQSDSAYDGKEGVKKVEEGDFDLVLLDLILPKEDGYHALVDIHKAAPDIPVLILTIIDSKTSLEECMANGATDYLVKSEYSLEDIVKKIKKILE